MSDDEQRPELPPALRRREAAAAGIAPEQLAAKVADGSWERLGRGLYAPADRVAIPWHTLHEVQRYAPRVVFCLETALAYHGLSDVRPSAIWISLARGMRRPAITWVEVEHVTVAPKLWEIGVEAYATDAGPLRITNVHRTIVDCFRFRRRVGLEIALQALRDARTAGLVSPADLLNLARTFRQEQVMLPYVEAVG